MKQIVHTHLSGRLYRFNRKFLIEDSLQQAEGDALATAVQKLPG